MTEQEFAEVLQHLQTQVRAHGLGDANDRIVSDIRVDPGRPSEQLVRYIDALVTELRLLDDQAVQRILDQANEYVRTESGRPIDGVTIILSESDRDTFGVDTVELGVSQDHTALIRSLEQLRGDLLDSRENS